MLLSGRVAQLSTTALNAAHFTRQEVLEGEFARVLRKFHVTPEVLCWLAEALRRSHADIRKFRREAISRLNADYTRLQHFLDTLYDDRLDGRIKLEFYDRKARKLRMEQDSIRQLIEGHEEANRSQVEEGLRLMELAARAHDLFARQHAEEKRRLLDFVLSNSTWKNGRLDVTFRQPFSVARAVDWTVN